MIKGKDKAAAGQRKFIGVTELRQRWNDCSQMFIERKLRSDPKFPRVYKIGRHRFFALDEVESYERAAIVPRSA